MAAADLAETSRPGLGATAWPAGRLPGLPWRSSDFSRTLWTTMFGAGSVTAAWVGSGQTAYVSRQFAWCALAVVGLIVTLTGISLWLLEAFRAVRLATATSTRFYSQPAAAPSLAVRPVGAVGRFTADRMTRHHASTCVLIQGKPAQRVIADEITAAGLLACSACAA